ncbi:hypothetical protein E4U41_003012, partial [Claviceps citrina]
MARRNRTMERIRAELLRRARMERQRDGVDAQGDGVQQEPAETEGLNDNSSHTRGIFPRCANLPRFLMATTTQQSSSQDSEGTKSPASPPRPITISSSRYGEPGAPSSLPSPLLSSQTPDTLSLPAQPAATSAYPFPRGHTTNLAPNASSPFPGLADHVVDETHSCQLSSPAEEPVSNTQSGPRAHSRRFLFCFPWMQSQRLQFHILMCFISGVFVISLLAVYLGLALTNHISRGEATIMIIVALFSATIFFCYSIVRLCMFVLRGHRSHSERVPKMSRPRGYAVPDMPIQVVLARDEEAAGIESETAKSQPPAYGLWRESVSSSPVAPCPGTRRPPSYASDDGISYVVEARPRSVAPPPLAYLPVS